MKDKDMKYVYNKRWIDTNEFYYKYGISKSSQAKLRMRGLISFSKIGGFVRYDVNEIDEWFEDHKVN